MPRNVAWRRTFSDLTCASQAFAVNATMYILRQTGPTGFLLQEEGDSKKFKVFLGDPHSCTCSTFRKEKDLCKHICWILLKKFRLDKDNPLSWQMGLSDLELDEVMRGPVAVRRNNQRQTQAAPHQVTDASGGRPLVVQREIAADDVCPICQDEFLDKKLPVTYCKFSCGNNIHIKCMKVWAEHQLKSSADQTIKCPMCREDFGPINLLKEEMRNANRSAAGPPPTAQANANRLDRHVGMGCSNCGATPIEGKCYRCCTCADFYLCQACFNTPAHTHHSFQFRHKRNQRWRLAQRILGAALPESLVNDLLNRDLSESDYETLLQLDDRQTLGGPLSDLTEDMLQQLPVEKVRERGALLAPGAQCRICLRPYTVGQYVKKLPCHHQFHKDCIDSWLLHSRSTCPVDSSPVFTSRPHAASSSFSTISPASQMSDLSVTSQGSRSASLPALGISCMRLGGADGEAGMAGERRTLTRRPPRPLHVPHHPPALLELTGTRVGAESSNAASLLEKAESEMLLPGGQLLHKAMQRRSQLGQHLTRLMLMSPEGGEGGNNTDAQQPDRQHSPSGTPPGRLEYSPLHRPRDLNLLQATAAHDTQIVFNSSGPLERGQSSSAGHGSGKRLATAMRGRAPLRQRSNSQDNLRPHGFQDLFLGNDPRVNPPPEGDVPVPANIAASHTQRHFRYRPVVGRKRAVREMGLEGNSVLEQLTLRDIL